MTQLCDQCEPLYKEIRELRADLKWVCDILDNFRRFEKVDYIKEHHKLDKVQP